MKLRITFTRLKRNFDDWIKALDFQRVKVTRSFKCQAIQPRCQLSFQKQLSTPAIFVGACGTENAPIAGRLLPLESYRHITGGLAVHQVEYVRRNPFHPKIHFFNRMFIIFRCSSTASLRSEASSFCRRRFKISRISGPDFPVAHTMNTRWNRLSYSRFPSAKASRTESPASATLRCSSSDHAADCVDAGCGDFRSPIRGCFENASIQSGTSSPRQISSDTVSSDASSCSGLRAATFRAHSGDPQHDTISHAAS